MKFITISRQRTNATIADSIDALSDKSHHLLNRNDNETFIYCRTFHRFFALDTSTAAVMHIATVTIPIIIIIAFFFLPHLKFTFLAP